jgi:hypothetical protein
MGADRRMGRNRGRRRSGRWRPSHLAYKIGPRAATPERVVARQRTMKVTRAPKAVYSLGA